MKSADQDRKGKFCRARHLLVAMRSRRVNHLLTGIGDFRVSYAPPAKTGTEVRGQSIVDLKAVLAVLAVIAGVALELTVGWPAIRRRGVLALRQVRVIAAAESVLLMGVSGGMCFVFVFMLGPALGEVLRSAAH